jgi:hypothetical protein
MRDRFGINGFRKPHQQHSPAPSPDTGETHKREASSIEEVAIPMPIARALVTIANHAWKAASRSSNPDSFDSASDLRRVQRSLTGIMEALNEIGLEVRNHTGDTFDYGLPLKVITAQPTQGIEKEVIIETLRPTLFWNNNIVQMGEVIIASPVKAGESHD